MSTTKILLAATVLAFVLAPTLAQAEEATSPSYAMKKQGRVPFAKETVAATEQTPATDVQNPADVEPAAGAEEPQAEQTQGRSALESQIRLPRKN